MKNKKIKIIIAVVSALILVLIIIQQKQKSEPRDVINTKSEIVKNPDNVATVKIGNNEKIQIRFFWETNGIKYNDALYFTPEEYAKLTPADIEKMKQERYDNWVKSVNEQSKQQ